MCNYSNLVLNLLLEAAPPFPPCRQAAVTKTEEHSIFEIWKEIQRWPSQSLFPLLRSNDWCPRVQASSPPLFQLPHTHSLLSYLFSSSSWFSSSIFSFCIPSTSARARWRFPSASVTYCSEKRAQVTKVNHVWRSELFKKGLEQENRRFWWCFRGCYCKKVDFPKSPV